jgi:hypothetical protein
LARPFGGLVGAFDKLSPNGLGVHASRASIPQPERVEIIDPSMFDRELMMTNR